MGINTSHPTSTQQRDLAFMLNVTGYSTAKLQKLYIDKEEDLEMEEENLENLEDKASIYSEKSRN